MNVNEIIIIKPLIPVGERDANYIRNQIVEQKSEGVIMLPFGYDVVVKPKEVEVKLGTDKDEDKVIRNAVTYICLADRNNRAAEANRMAQILYDRAYRKGFEAGKLEGHEKIVEKVVYSNTDPDDWSGDLMGKY